MAHDLISELPSRADRLCCVDGSHGGREGGSMNCTRRPGPPVRMPWVHWLPFPARGDLVGLRWYLRYGLSYRDLEDFLAERGIEVDDVTLYRWVQRFTPLLIDAARPCRHLGGDRWFCRPDLVKVSGVSSYDYPAVDQHGQVIDVYVSQRRDIASAIRFFTVALAVHGVPIEFVTGRAPALANVIEDRVPAAWLTPASTRTAESNATTAGSRPGSGRCAGWRPLERRAW